MLGLTGQSKDKIFFPIKLCIDRKKKNLNEWIATMETVVKIRNLKHLGSFVQGCRTEIRDDGEKNLSGTISQEICVRVGGLNRHAILTKDAHFTRATNVITLRRAFIITAIFLSILNIITGIIETSSDKTRNRMFQLLILLPQILDNSKCPEGRWRARTRALSETDTLAVGEYKFTILSCKSL